MRFRSPYSVKDDIVNTRTEMCFKIKENMENKRREMCFEIKENLFMTVSKEA